MDVFVLMETTSDGLAIVGIYSSKDKALEQAALTIQRFYPELAKLQAQPERMLAATERESITFRIVETTLDRKPSKDLRYVDTD